jgi:hypothetical protein
MAIAYQYETLTEILLKYSINKSLIIYLQNSVINIKLVCYIICNIATVEFYYQKLNFRFSQ